MVLCVASNTNEFARELASIRKRLGMNIRAFAARLEIPEARYKNWEYGLTKSVPGDVMEKARTLDRPEVGPLGIPLAVAARRIPHIGGVSAGMMVEWTDPIEDATEFEPVPPGFEGKGRFSATVLGDCMMPFLQPGDMAVFQAEMVPKLNAVVLWRTFDNRITIKQLKHNGREYVLHPLNPSYEDQRADGSQVGYLIGVIQDDGIEQTTRRNLTGLKP